MLSVYCPRHGQHVLLGHRQILGIEGSGDELAIRWVCWCGHHGTQRTGIRPQSVVTEARAEQDAA